MHLLKGSFDLLIVVVLIGGGFWGGWTARTLSDPLFNVYNRVNQIRVQTIDTLIFWD